MKSLNSFTYDALLPEFIQFQTQVISAVHVLVKVIWPDSFIFESGKVIKHRY